MKRLPVWVRFIFIFHEDDISYNEARKERKIEMKKCILINSATHLQRAKKLLFANNIKCYAEKSRQPSAFGCSWCIVVEGTELSRTIKLFQQRGIPVHGIKNYD